jgi:hypothetical protein
MDAPHTRPAPFTIQDLYPSLTPEDAALAESNLRRYLDLALRVYARLEQDHDVYAQFTALTASRQSHRVQGTGSLPPSTSTP